MRTLCLIASLIALLCLAPTRASAQPLIVIDAGHGGSDPGAVGCSLQEADVVLDVSTRLRTFLEGAGIRVALTRDSDVAVGLTARATFANGMSADGFVSIHSNANGGTPATGTETWIANAAGARSLSLATGIQNAMVAEWALADRGVKRADFVVVRATTMPSALAELAFTNRCTPDAALLGSATARQRLAVAQGQAILDWLGVSPVMGGILRGVVFEDQGVGTMDLSVRLPGASVRIMETGATFTAAAPDGAWSFMLPAGTYTVVVDAAGHTRSTRTCMVTTGTTWCSIGLFPAAMEDAAVLMPDAGRPVDAAVAPVDARAPAVDAAAAAVDATVNGDTGGVIRPLSVGCGCSAATSPHRASASLAFLLLMSAVLWRRRARAALLVTSAATLGCSEEAAPAQAPVTQRAPTIALREGAPLRVTEEREFLVDTTASGALQSPILSADGHAVLLSSGDFNALYVLALDAEGARPTLITDAPRSGFEPRWVDATHIGVRTPEQSRSALPSETLSLDGQPEGARLNSHAGLAWVDAEDEGLVRVRVGGQTRTLHDHDDRFLSAELSSDGAHVIVWGMTTGLTLHRLRDNARLHIEGSHPRFDASGNVLVFDRTEDEGHDLTRADVFVARLSGQGLVTHRYPERADGVSTLEVAPSASRFDADAGVISMMREGVLVVSNVQLP